MTDLKGKIALVTGSGRGLGKAIAERYARLGASLVLNYSSSAQATQETVATIEQLGGTAIAVQADVSKVADIDRLFATAMERFSHLDIVVANAGIELVSQPILDFTEADFDRLFNVNTRGAFFTLQRAAKYVADNGRIIYIGSSSTAYPMPGYALYGGSKMAPRFLVEVMAKELGARRITVNSILPSATENAGVFTDAGAPEVREFILNLNPMQRMGTLEDTANAAEYLASELSSFVSGQHLLLSGGAPG